MGMLHAVHFQQPTPPQTSWDVYIALCVILHTPCPQVSRTAAAEVCAAGFNVRVRVCEAVGFDVRLRVCEELSAAPPKGGHVARGPPRGGGSSSVPFLAWKATWACFVWGGRGGAAAERHYTHAAQEGVLPVSWLLCACASWAACSADGRGMPAAQSSASASASSILAEVAANMDMPTCWGCSSRNAAATACWYCVRGPRVLGLASAASIAAASGWPSGSTQGLALYAAAMVRMWWAWALCAISRALL
eukprot:1160396-Pelagomonas_calceolata.AAC.22